MNEKQTIEWIPVNENLPSCDETLLLRSYYEGEYSYSTGEYWGLIGGEHRFGYNNEYEFDFVTHWAKLV